MNASARGKELIAGRVLEKNEKKNKPMSVYNRPFQILLPKS